MKYISFMVVILGLLFISMCGPDKESNTNNFDQHFRELEIDPTPLTLPIFQPILDRKPIVISANRGEWKYFSFSVPPPFPNISYVKYPIVTLHGGFGDPDLYIRHKYVPSQNCYMCKSDGPGTSEYCSSLTSKDGSTIYIGIYAYRTFQNVKLMADYVTTEPTPAPELDKQEILADKPVRIYGKKFRWKYFYIDLPINYDLTTSLSKGWGNPELYVKQGSSPTKWIYDCRSKGSGTNESCLIEFTGGRIYIGVYSRSSYGNVELLATYKPSGQPMYEELVGLSAKKGEWRYFNVGKIKRSPDGPLFFYSAKLLGGIGDPNLYMWPKYHNPKTNCYICSSEDSGTDESCMETGGFGIGYLGVYANTEYKDVTLKVHWHNASATPTPYPSKPMELANGQSLKISWSSSENVYKKFYADVPEDSTVIAVLSGGQGDPDLYVSAESFPNENSYNCKSEMPGTQESCAIAHVSGRVYLSVYAYLAYRDVNIVVTW